MAVCFEELTVDELLHDPLTRLVMQADGVDTTALRDMFDVLASEIAARPKPVPALRRSAISGLLRLVAGRDNAMPDPDCFCGAR